MTMAPSTSEREWLDGNGNEIEDHDRGLVFDIQTLVDRRRALSLFGGLGVAGALAACSSGSPATTGSTSTAAASSATTTTAATSAAATSTTSTAADGDLVEAPDETAGPYPGDGSNGQNVLDDSGIVRADIRSGFGSSSTTAEGVPLTIRLTVRDSATGDAMPGAAVYIWHCDRDGNYSLYSEGFEDVNYLRGVQSADDTGTVSFTSVFPGCYPGRWPHIHFEVYESVDGATSAGPIVKTSQIALPKEACEVADAADGYQQSVESLAQTSLKGDMVFADDGGIHQLASMSGSVEDGYVAALTVGV
jgi:protocatechuate 3,4-dioxygenase beta subunit